MNDDLVPVLHVYVRMYADKPHIHTRYTHMYNEFNRIIKKYQRKCLYTHTHTPCVYLYPCVGDRGVWFCSYNLKSFYTSVFLINSSRHAAFRVSKSNRSIRRNWTSNQRHRRTKRRERKSSTSYRTFSRISIVS